jgi:acyl carrier protein
MDKNKIITKKEISFLLKKLIFKNKVIKNFSKINIFKLKQINSLTIFKIILAIESKYKIKLEDEEIFSNQFNSINKISILVFKKIKKLLKNENKKS